MKNISAIVAESGAVRDFTIQPGTTARDVLNQLGLDNRYVLSRGRGSEPFGEDENIYESIPDGAKLIASTPVEVGAGKPPPSILPLRKVMMGLRDVIDVQSVVSQIEPINRMPVRRSMEARTVVRRDTRPYWQQRDWFQNRGEYHGYYRTTYGAWQGKATMSISGRVELFIRNPPGALRTHSHWMCFRDQSDGWYFIHTSTPLSDLSAGIIRVEQILTEAHRSWTGKTTNAVVSTLRSLLNLR